MITEDAVGTAAAVRAGEVTPAELVRAAAERIERADPALNALSWTRFEEALAEAGGELPDGPFRGVPILLKDHRCLAAGQETRFGTAALTREPRPWHSDSNIYRAIRAAGFVVLGRTTTPELATALITESDAAGVTRNPDDPAFTAGGSSGGSAAAVAAGMVPVAHATDGGGSIRVPAAACGLVGLKASRGRVSLGPDTGESWGGATTEGMLCRTVRDAAATFEVISGHFPGDPYTAPALPIPLSAALAEATPALRVGVLGALPGGAPFPDREAAALVDRIAGVLDGWGHRVAPAAPPALAAPHFGADFALLVAVDVELLARRIEAHAGLGRGELELAPRNTEHRARAAAAGSVDYLDARYRLGRWSAELARWWEREIDILVTPTLAGPLPLAGGDTGLEQRGVAMTPLTSYFNVSGQPAISLPLGRSASGLPLGIQLVAPYGREDLLVRLARDFEERGPWCPAGQ
ncbi:amidase [Nocardia sp. NPDC050697]|uniref:amidase n=1 Tax=Nocardia sp. NPDC050697 TaxID=3155158 RepID=UPI00340206DE